MTDLSPAAKSVLDAFLSEWDVYAVDEARHGISAALRALADQVVPDEGDFLTPAIATNIRAAILAIATELEGRP